MDNKKKEGWKKDIIEFVKTFLPAAAVAWILLTYFIVNAAIPSASMEPTLMTGSRVIGNRLAYQKESPKRGDIIIFRFPDNPDLYYIKRLIGLPGDTVEIVPNESGDGYGYVKVNGEKRKEGETVTRMRVDHYECYKVPENHYFFMGDNRNNSHDSRYWNHTFVSKDQIVAKAVFQYWKEFRKIG